MRRVAAEPGAVASAVGQLGTRPVYLHLDIDVIDGAELRGARFPSGPGPSLDQIEECLAAVCGSAEVVAAYIACAWLPDHVADRATRETITRLVRAVGTQLSWP